MGGTEGETAVELQVLKGDQWEVHGNYSPIQSVVAIHKAKSLEKAGGYDAVRVIKLFYDSDGDLDREEIIHKWPAAATADRGISSQEPPELRGPPQVAAPSKAKPSKGKPSSRPKPSKSAKRRPKPAGKAGRGFIFLLTALLVLAAALFLVSTKTSLFTDSAEKPHSIAQPAEISPMDKWMVLGNGVKIRAQPSMKANSVGTLEAGAKIKVTGKTDVGGATWYRVIRYGGKYGYLPAAAFNE